MPTLEEIKGKQQVAWSSGDYGRIAWITQPLGDAVCEAVDLRPGSSVLDVACGTGHAALAAARRFCWATGVDYVPSLLEVARSRAASESLEVDFVEGDAEDLPFPPDGFDYVLSTIGAMFAPNQEKVAEELFRVCRSGGTVGMVNWKPEGFVGEVFKLIGGYVPPPQGLKPAALWGTEERVKELFGENTSEILFAEGALRWYLLGPEHFADFFLTNYGPTLKAGEALKADEQGAFREDLAKLGEKFNQRPDGALTLEASYLTVVASKP